MDSDIQKLVELTKFSLKFREIKRKTYYSHNQLPENDAEHSWQLAFLAMYIIQTYEFNYSLDKVLQYALLHDLVEIHAGDLGALHRTSEQTIKKQQDEKEAFEAIKKQFPEWNQMHQIIHDYENRVDEEAKFVYVLDKILPVLNIMSDNGYRWHQEWYVLQDEIDAKIPKNLTQSPELYHIFQKIVKAMQEKENIYFPKV